MSFVKFKRGRWPHEYVSSDDLRMDILGRFLAYDLSSVKSFQQWALEHSDIGTSSNITNLDKENGYIYLSDLYSEEKVPTKLKMSIKQFIQILDDWETKVCKARPQAVTIRYENDQFSIETEN